MVSRRHSEPLPEDVEEVLSAVAARLDTLARRRTGRGEWAPGAQHAQAAPARPRAVSLHDVPWAAQGSFKRFGPGDGAHSEASAAPALSALPRHTICRVSSADAASRASTAQGSSFAEGALARRRRVEAPSKLCLMTGAESASDKASKDALDDAPEDSERSARQARSPSAAAALVSAVLTLLAALLSAAFSILSSLCSSRPPWWPESPQRPARQGDGRAPVSPWRAPVSPWSGPAAGLDLLLIDWMDADPY